MKNINTHIIGQIHGPFKEKFGIPRQSGLIEGNLGSIELYKPWGVQEALQGLDGFSHLWVVFVFHEAMKGNDAFRPTVRPPRLGGNKRQGVFATRSPYRPNPIGISTVKYLGWEKKGRHIHLSIEGADVLNGTPVLDIKPYLPYADSIPDALGGFAHDAPSGQEMDVQFTRSASKQLAQAQQKYPHIQRLIETALAHDPRPAYFGSIDQREDFGMKLYDYDVQWKIDGNTITVTSL